MEIRITVVKNQEDIKSIEIDRELSKKGILKIFKERKKVKFS